MSAFDSAELAEFAERFKDDQAFHSALGKFIQTFSTVEAWMQRALWCYAKTPEPIGRAVFSGVRIKEGMGLIGRICDVSRISSKKRADLKYIFGQLGIINDLRNDMLHYGARRLTKDWKKRLVSNKRIAITRSRLKTTTVTTETLKDLSAYLVAQMSQIEW